MRWLLAVRRLRMSTSWGSELRVAGVDLYGQGIPFRHSRLALRSGTRGPLSRNRLSVPAVERHQRGLEALRTQRSVGHRLSSAVRRPLGRGRVQRLHSCCAVGVRRALGGGLRLSQQLDENLEGVSVASASAMRSDREGSGAFMAATMRPAISVV